VVSHLFGLDIQEELSEVPRDLLGASLRLQPLVDVSSIVIVLAFLVNENLAGHPEFDALSLSEFRNDLFGFALLRTELVAWEPEDGQASFAVVGMHLN